MTEPSDKNASGLFLNFSKYNLLVYPTIAAVVCIAIYIMLYSYSKLYDVEMYSGMWNTAYDNLLKDPVQKDNAICSFLREQVKTFHAKNNRYPTNEEGFSVINLSAWSFSKSADYKGYTLELLGPALRVTYKPEDPSYLYGLWEPPPPVHYLYLNKNGIASDKLSGLAEYEPPELMPLIKIDEGVLIYSPDLRNAAQYNKKVQAIANAFNSSIIVLWATPFIAFVVIVVLFIWLVKVTKTTPYKHLKRLLGLVSVAFGLWIGPILSPPNPIFYTCYEPLPFHRDLIAHFRVWNITDDSPDSLNGLLKKFQERGVLSKNTIEKIQKTKP